MDDRITAVLALLFASSCAAHRPEAVAPVPSASPPIGRDAGALSAATQRRVQGLRERAQSLRATILSLPPAVIENGVVQARVGQARGATPEEQTKYLELLSAEVRAIDQLEAAPESPSTEEQLAELARRLFGLKARMLLVTEAILAFDSALDGGTAQLPTPH